MANETESILYSYEGDTSSLRAATQEAISLLDQYDAALRRATSSANFGTNDKASYSIKNAMNGMLKQVSTLQKLANAMPTKSAAGSAVTFLAEELAGQRMQTVGDVVQHVRTEMQLLGAVATVAWQRISKAVSPVTAQVQSLQARATAALNRMTAVPNQISAAFRRIPQALSGSQDALRQLVSTSRSLVQAFTSLNLRVNTNVQSFFNLTKASHALKTAVHALLGLGLGRMLAQATNESISFYENLNLFTVAMGDAYEQGQDFVDQMAELYGMDPSNLMRYAGNFYQLADAIDMPAKASAALSLGLTKATNDIASLFNMPVETVFENLSSGMQGMSRAVRKYGMDIRVTTLEQTALSLGITEQVENMSEANRQGLRFITMMQQAQNASGDFAATIESPANQLRIFREQIGQLGRAIADLFIGPLTQAIAYINGFIMALRMIIQFIGSIFGVIGSLFGRVSGLGEEAEDTTDDLSDSIGGVGSAAKDATKELRKMLAPFDELNLLQKPDEAVDVGGGGGGGLGDLGVLDPAILKAIEEMQWKLDEVEMKAVKVRNAILDFLGFTVQDGAIVSWDSAAFEQNLIDKFPQWTKTIQATFANWTDIIEGFKSVFKSLGTVADTIWSKITGKIKETVNDDSASSFITNLAGNLQSLASWIERNANGIANFVIAFNVLKLLAPAATVLGSMVSNMAKLAGVIPSVMAAVATITGPMLAWAAIIGVAGVAIFDLLKNNEEFRHTVGEAWQSVITLISDLWSTVLKPVLDSIGDALKTLYENVLRPIVGQVATLILDLWSGILQPLVSWFIVTLGPVIANVIQDVVKVFSWMLDNVGGVISGILQVLQGIINFIAGVFSGDWRRAWEGVVQIFSGVFNTVASVVVAVINAVITVINGAFSAIYYAVVSVINLVLGAINAIGQALGFTLELGITAGAPQIGYLEAPRVGLANGGVVTEPTKALIGEGRYDEAVVPLGNSPQMRQFADSVADRVNNGEQTMLLREQNDLLRQILEKTGVSLDGQVLTDTISRYQRQRSRATGV